jgi:putative ABC transport system permease protein
MKLRKCLRHAFLMVVHSKLRSWLTILGIVIGVAAVIAIVSIGEGMQADIASRLGGLGGDIVTVSAGFSRGGEMFGPRDREGGSSGQATTKEVVVGRADVQVLKGIPEISLIETEIRGNVNISYLGKSGRVSVTGVDQKVWSQITTATIRDGRFLDAADQNVVVVGARLADTYFSQPLGINKMITIEGSSFRVVGILDDQSTTIYMPINMAYQVIDSKSIGVYDSIIVKVKDESQLDSTIISMQQRLMLSRHVTNKTMDFSVTSSKQMQETRAQAMSSVNAFLLAIAGVSLIVGAVGVANTMFTSVMEKTKEIGIMKAIGARNRDILLIFVFNSALIGLVGGIIGIILGGILSGLLPSIMASIPFARGSTLVSMNSVIMAVCVSVGVGILAGIVPAYQASKLKPVDALRYE